jgi:alpha-L-fucosidase
MKPHLNKFLGFAMVLLAAGASALAQTRAKPPPIPLPAKPAAPLPEKIEITPGPFQPTVDSLKRYECPEWFRDAKFGLWSHWGPQSVPMNDGWYARRMYEEGRKAYQYHVEHYGHPSVFGYKDIIQLWKAEKFDPAHVMQLYAEAGAKYFVTIGAHHDNFDLWDSKYHSWNSVNYGPQKDIVGLYREAARKQGLRFGVSEHIARSYSWFNPSHGADRQGPLAGVPYDGNDPRFAELYFTAHADSRVTYPTNAPEVVQRDWFYRVKDLLERYDVDLLYTDGAIPFGDVGCAFLADFYNSNLKRNGGRLQAVYNIKDIKDHGEYIDGACVLDVERGRLKDINAEPWQTCTSTGPWFYNRGINYAQEGTNAIRLLVDVVSKNGNLLLNVPQLPDGSFEPAAEQMLRDFGAWMKVNGEGIYATRPWKIFGEGGNLRVKDPKLDPANGATEKARADYTAEDIRFTRSKDGGTLYAFCLGQPTNAVRIVSLGVRAKLAEKPVAAVQLLGYPGKLDWQQQAEALVIKLPANLSPSPAIGFKIVLGTNQSVAGAINDDKMIRTPKPPQTPRINGPKIFGVRPGSPFLFRIPATGERPMTFAAEKLPAGLSLDAKSGIITGAVKERGSFVVTLVASNALGVAKREFRIEVGDRLALTPPMGWNSYYGFRLSISDKLIREQADAMVKSGLADHGWSYINLDEGWTMNPAAKDPLLNGTPREADGRIQFNGRFPDMKALADYVHGQGLKIGLYSSPGPLNCGGFVGSYQHEEQDAQTYADWGFDFLKYDWCSYKQIAKDDSVAEARKPYELMARALQKPQRDIVFSFCQYGMGNSPEWAADAGGNTWRTTRDIIDKWETVANYGFGQAGLEKFSGPGRWNDPDMLMVGVMARNTPSRLTADEQYTHVSLWCLLNAPLLIGGDLRKLDDFTLGLLTNDEVIEVNQDPLGQQASRIAQDATAQTEVWAKRMADGSRAVGLFNRSGQPAKVTATWGSLQLSSAQVVRDVWRQKNLGVFTNEFSATIPAHGVELIRVGVKK